MLASGELPEPEGCMYSSTLDPLTRQLLHKFNALHDIFLSNRVIRLRGASMWHARSKLEAIPRQVAISVSELRKGPFETII
jgi:hypothetical protein